MERESKIIMNPKSQFIENEGYSMMRCPRFEFMHDECFDYQE